MNGFWSGHSIKGSKPDHPDHIKSGLAKAGLGKEIEQVHGLSPTEPTPVEADIASGNKRNASAKKFVRDYDANTGDGGTVSTSDAIVPVAHDNPSGVY